MTDMSLLTPTPARADIKARTLRQDRYWIQPLVIAVGFAAFVVYSTWAAFNHPIVAGTTRNEPLVAVRRTFGIRA